MTSVPNAKVYTYPSVEDTYMCKQGYVIPKDALSEADKKQLVKDLTGRQKVID